MLNMQIPYSFRLRYRILILIYPIEVNNYQGTELSIVIFEQILGNFGKYIGVFFLFTFSLATIVSSFYSGETNMLYLSTFYKIPIKTTKIIYKILFIFGIFLGIFMNNKTIWNLVDYGLICLGLIHLIVLILLQHDFKQKIWKNFHIDFFYKILYTFIAWRVRVCTHMRTEQYYIGS